MKPLIYHTKLIATATLILFAIIIITYPAVLFASPGNTESLSEKAFFSNFSSTLPLNPGLQNIMNQQRSSRLVMQIIENQFHMWREYEDPLKDNLFIYMLEPYKKALTETEAALLLALSRDWQRQSLHYQSASMENSNDAGKYLFPEIGLKELPGTSLQRNNISQLEEMTDNRTPVGGDQAIIYPYYTVGFLAVDFPSELMRGTAFLISPYTALTNAHNVYAPDYGGWFEVIGFSPGQYETEEKNMVQPFTTLSPVKAEATNDFIEYENNNDRDNSIKYDYAALFFEEPFSGISTFMPLQFNHVPSQIGLLGYPGLVRNEFTLGMWSSEGPVIESDKYFLYYSAYTSGGSSGSPVFVYNQQADTHRVASIHSFTSANLFSGGPHFNDKNKDIIEKWLLWTPENLTDPVTSLSLNKTSLTMEIGTKEVLIATVHPSDASKIDLKWSSSNPEVADVDANGVVSASGAGSTVITVKTADGGKEATCNVIVVDASTVLRLGDLNGDGKIDVLDVVLLMQAVLELLELDEEALARADVNLDGNVNVVDVTLVMQYTLGMIKAF